ncbi:hypothetical protein LAZ67_6001507 [Cordylochernes scorpioides]|uniref:RRM domain-containing protein n=1 Tax=Cordylochernes scorpioides TaxID=51811 RepID=A0ABY6KJ67_9ARAC|nr:hypothetical protein LAZ67_6001507 [Cordylochernes scorpioides]
MSGKLFVKNIPYNTSDEQFKEFFNQFGKVIEARIVCEESGRSKGFGFVTFSTQGAANALIGSEEFLELENRKLIIKASVSKVTRPLNSEICVKNLPFETTDDQFFEFFGTFGLVQKARVIRKASGESRGFGYVVFSTEETAKALIKREEPVVIGERTLLIEVPKRRAANIPEENVVEEGNPSSPAPQNKRSPIPGDICVKNIPYSTTNEQLAQFFSSFGQIKDARVICTASGNPKGFGIVAFSNQETVNTLLDREEPLIFNNRKLFIEDKRKDANKIISKYIFVRNVAADISDEQFFEYFNKFGEVTKAKVTRQDSGQSKGFCFVSFATEEIAKAVINLEDSLVLNNKKNSSLRIYKQNLIPAFFASKIFPSTPQRRSSYFRKRNLLLNTTNEKFSQYFTTFGEVAKAKVICSASGQSKGFGFVTFSNIESAKALFERKEPLILGRKIIFVEASIPDKTETPASASSKPTNSGPTKPVPRKPLATKSDNPVTKRSNPAAKPATQATTKSQPRTTPASKQDKIFFNNFERSLRNEGVTHPLKPGHIREFFQTWFKCEVEQIYFRKDETTKKFDSIGFALMFTEEQAKILVGSHTVKKVTFTAELIPRPEESI